MLWWKRTNSNCGRRFPRCLVCSELVSRCKLHGKKTKVALNVQAKEKQMEQEGTMSTFAQKKGIMNEKTAHNNEERKSMAAKNIYTFISSLFSIRLFVCFMFNIYFGVFSFSLCRC